MSSGSTSTAMEMPRPPAVAASPRLHNPLQITVLNQCFAFHPGDTINGQVRVCLHGEVIDSMEVLLVGISETDFSPGKRSSHLHFNRHSVLNKNVLLEVVTKLIQSPISEVNGAWPFEFKIPEFTDTTGKYGPSRTSRKFAIQRHRLPPTFEQHDVDGNTARITYGILARMSRDSRNLAPYQKWHELRLETSKEEQKAPSSERHELKPVIRRLHQSNEFMIFGFFLQRLRKLLLHNGPPSGRYLRLTPSIFIPDQIFPGRPLPVTILFTPKPQGAADPDRPRVELINLKIILKEETSILAKHDKSSRLRTMFGRASQPVRMAERQFTIDEQHLETSKPTTLEQEDTQSLLKRVYTPDSTLHPNIKTFNISKTHAVMIHAEFICEAHTFRLDHSIPVTVLQRRVLPSSFPEDVTTIPGTPGGDSLCSSCPTCRHQVALHAARQLLAPGRLPEVLEYSNESTVTNTLGPPTRTSIRAIAPLSRTTNLHRMGSSGEQNLQAINEGEDVASPRHFADINGWPEPPRRGYMSVM